MPGSSLGGSTHVLDNQIDVCGRRYFIDAWRRQRVGAKLHDISELFHSGYLPVRTLRTVLRGAALQCRQRVSGGTPHLQQRLLPGIVHDQCGLRRRLRMRISQRQAWLLPGRRIESGRRRRRYFPGRCRRCLRASTLRSGHRQECRLSKRPDLPERTLRASAVMTGGGLVRTLIGFSFVCTVPVAELRSQPAWSPQKNVEFIVPTAAGSTMDALARIIQDIWQKNRLVNTSMTVMVRPGSGGAIAWTYVSRKTGDGHYLAISGPTLLANDIMGIGDLSYRDVTPIAQLFTEYTAFAVPADGTDQDQRRPRQSIEDGRSPPWWR